MKKINLIRFLFLSCILLSCEPKKEKKEPVIIHNNQNFRYDDDELTKKNTKDSIDSINHLEKKKRGKVAVEK